MKNKKIICVALAAALTMGVAFSGCVSTNNEEDMKQTIATVNITRSQKLDKGLSDYTSAVKDEVIIKRDLVNAFVNVGSSYVNNGMSYEATFNMLLDELANNAIIVQYATLYLLKSKVEEQGSTITLAGYNAKTTEAEKLIYVLGGEDSDSVMKAQYNLYVSINGALDSYEDTDEDDEDEYVGTDTRSAPTGIDATVEDYLPLTDKGKLDYGIYTGYEGYLLSDAGQYEPKDKSNRNTRRKAYARFLKNIKSNYLLSDEDENKTDIMQLSYVQSQYVSQLEQSVINEFYDVYTEEQEKKIMMVDEFGEYTFVKQKYDGLIEEEELTNSDSSKFESAIGNVSDTSFVLWSPDTRNDTQEGEGDTAGTFGTFGYVYNILLPFSVTQSRRLTKLQSARTNEIITENDYFVERNNLMRDIVTTDQRAAWFNGEKDYSFDAAKFNEENPDNAITYFTGANTDRKYLFFENNLTKKTEYESLDRYWGEYTYNGKVIPNKDGSYTLVPQELTIDDMLAEFSAYINYVLGTTDSVEVHAGDTLSGGTGKADYDNYYKSTDFYFADADREDEIDYSKLVYATGMVDLKDKSKENMFLASSDRYKAMAAVNELQYAYTTDTGVLSQYIGYTVSAYSTNYIKEFEYAAQQAIRMGVGAFKVCAGDYGWHLIYVTDSFDFKGGAVYKPNFTKERVETEGTFENLFFEWIKNQTLSNEEAHKRTEILQYFSDDNTITKFKKAYKDLLELG